MLRNWVPHVRTFDSLYAGRHVTKVDESCVPANLFRPELTVMDIVYNPRETKLLQEAKAGGCRTISGLEMFLNQAVMQFELWTKQPAGSTSCGMCWRRALSSGWHNFSPSMPRRILPIRWAASHEPRLDRLSWNRQEHSRQTVGAETRTYRGLDGC